MHLQDFVCSCSGENWKAAMTAGSSPLHILDPTGFEVDLQKSIVDDSAYLPRFVVVLTIKFMQLQRAYIQHC